jgi:hypothetical protein
MTGRSGLLGGGQISYVDATHVDIEPYSFVQGGIVVVNEDGHDNLIVPSVAVEVRPVFIIVGTPSIDESTGITLAVTTDLSQVTPDSIVLATRYNGVWSNPPRLTSAGISSESMATDADVSAGVIDGLDLRPVTVAGIDGVIQVFLGTGKAVDARGKRDLLDRQEDSFNLTDVTAVVNPHPVDTWFPRTDYVALRTPDGFPGPNAGPVRIVGGTVARHGAFTASGTQLAAAATVSRAAIAYQDGVLAAKAFYVWLGGGGGNDLDYSFIQQDTGETVINSGTILSTGFAFLGVDDVCVVHIAGTNRFVVLYCENTGATRKLMAMSYDPTAAATIDAAVDISGAFSNIQAPRAVMDSTGVMHVVAIGNDGSTADQALYWRVDVTTGATFGTAVSGTPRIASGIDDGDTDLSPSIAIDRRDNVHIAYQKGAAPSDCILVTLDRVGTLVAGPINISEFAVSSAVGGGGLDTNPYNLIKFGITHATKPRVIVTPQDEVFILYSAGIPAVPATPAFFYLYNKDFNDRFRAPAIDMFFGAFGGWLDRELLTDELGTLVMVGRNAASLHFKRLDTFIPEGKTLLQSTLQSDTPLVGAGATSFSGLIGPSGSLKISYQLVGSLETKNAALSVTGHVTPHPTDRFLGAWTVSRFGLDAPVGTPISPRHLHVQRARPVRQSSPILVGRDGDFLGYDSLNEAISAAFGTGHQIRLQPGIHKLFVQDGPSFIGPVDIVGAPGSIVDLDIDDISRAVTLGGRGAVVIADVGGAPGVVSVVGGTAGMFPGDLIAFMSVAPPDPLAVHHVVEVIDATHLRLFPTAATGGGAVVHFSSSVRIRGCRFVSTNTAGVLKGRLLVQNTWKPDIEGCDGNGVQFILINCGPGRISRCLLRLGAFGLGACFDTEFSHNTALGEDELAMGGGIALLTSRRLSVHGNRSYGHVPALPDYKATANAELFGWSDNQDSGKTNAYISDDPGELVSRDVVLRARNSVITKDLVAQRINAGIYDARLAALAAEIDTLKSQNTLTLAFGEIVYFDDESALI